MVATALGNGIRASETVAVCGEDKDHVPSSPPDTRLPRFRPDSCRFLASHTSSQAHLRLSKLAYDGGTGVVLPPQIGSLYS